MPEEQPVDRAEIAADLDRARRWVLVVTGD